jgi:hypothetical protein
MAFFACFMGADAFVWILNDPRIPTFSRCVTRVIPWWISLPAIVILFWHFLIIYLEKQS